MAESVDVATSDEQLIAMLVERAQAEGMQLTGEATAAMAPGPRPR